MEPWAPHGFLTLSIHSVSTMLDYPRSTWQRPWNYQIRPLRASLPKSRLLETTYSGSRMLSPSHPNTTVLCCWWRKKELDFRCSSQRTRSRMLRTSKGLSRIRTRRMVRVWRLSYRLATGCLNFLSRSETRVWMDRGRLVWEQTFSSRTSLLISKCCWNRGWLHYSSCDRIGCIGTGLWVHRSDEQTQFIYAMIMGYVHRSCY